MSGLSRFVKKGEQDGARTQAADSRLDAAAAQALKFGAKPRNFEPAPAPPGQLLPSTAPAPGYASNHNASRNTFPSNQFARQPPPQYTKQKLFDDDTISSNFEDTKTDIGYDLEDEDGEYGQEEESHGGHQYEPQADSRYSHGLPRHTLHHVHAQVPLVVNPESEYTQIPFKPQASGTHSRFKSVKPVVSDQNADAMNQQSPVSKKRHRSDEPPRQIHEQQRRPHDDEFEESGGYEFPGHQSQERQNHFEVESDAAETPSSSPTRQRKARVAQSSQPTMGDGLPPPDYTDEKLKSMKYSDLKAEDWDNFPNPKAFKLPAKLRGKSLAEQIAYYADRSKKDDDAEDVLFYEHLSTSEWEQAGDIIVDKFADLLKQLKEKRQAKRRITEQFEAEMEAREKAVRGKSNLFEKKLREMQASGQDMLKGKMI